MQKLKILYVANSLEVGGAEKSIVDLIQNLDHSKFELQVALLKTAGDLATPQLRAQVPIRVFNWHGGLDTLRLCREFYSFLKRGQFTVLHTHLFRADIIGRIIGRLAGVPIIVSTQHNKDLDSRVQTVMIRLTSGLVDEFIAVSETVSNYCLSKLNLPRSKVLVINNGINTRVPVISAQQRSELRKQLGLAEASQVIGCVGRQSVEKGHEIMLASMPQILAAVPEARLLLVGDGPLRGKLMEQAANLGISDQVVFAGSRQDVPQLIQTFDLFVQPSLKEGMPLAVLEAMNAELPVVAAAVGGVPDLIGEQEGRLFPPGDYGQLASSVLWMLNNPQRKGIGQAGAAKVAKEFNLDTQVRCTEVLYQDLAQAKGIGLCPN